MQVYDAIIIGAGQSGVPLAKKLAEEGLKTALIEKNLVGGTCVNVGCTPTKTMIASGRIAHLTRNSRRWGIETSSPIVHLAEIVRRKNEVVTSFREGSQKGLEETEGLDLLFGEASFTDTRIVNVQLNSGNSETLTADKIFIDVGASTTIPAIEGLQNIDYLTSTTILDLEIVPEHLLIVGASYVALEFGQLFKRLGSRVTILEKSDQFLRREDEDVAAELKHILQDEGIVFHFGSMLQAVSKQNNGQIAATLNENTVIHCSHVLIAAGRTPQTKALNLRKTGVEVNDRGYIKVNDLLETTTGGIYAMGDVKGGPAFTHISYNDYIIVYRNLFHHAQLSVKSRFVPYCMFTDPQLGRVGITEKEAAEQGLDYEVASIPMSSVARAIETAETRGLMKAIVDRSSKQILGAAVLGVEGGEVMSVLQMAMMGGLTYEEVKYAVLAHPTFSESLNNLFMSLDK